MCKSDSRVGHNGADLFGAWRLCGGRESAHRRTTFAIVLLLFRSHFLEPALPGAVRHAEEDARGGEEEISTFRQPERVHDDLDITQTGCDLSDLPKTPFGYLRASPPGICQNGSSPDLRTPAYLACPPVRRLSLQRLHQGLRSCA